jgi:hypothetical protein
MSVPTDAFASSFDYKTILHNGRAIHVPVSRYAYERFEGGRPQIRLLRYLGLDPSDNTPRFRIEKHNLDETVPFVALSYRWGDPSRYAVISVDNAPFPVTTNLFYALERLRQPGIALWVDALCIDQCNETEKGSHVPLIKSIYERADLTWVSLGPSADGSEKVLQVFNDISRGRNPDIRALRRLRPELFAFFRRDYWQRVWIVQELAVSRRLLFVCGPASVWWAGIECFLELVHRDKGTLYSDFGHMQHLRLARLAYKSAKPLGLLEVLSHSRATEATNPLDKVFALLALSVDANTFTRSPSYAWDPVQSCIELTTNAIRQKTTLDIFSTLDIIFSASHDTELSPLLPTWVPDLLHFGHNSQQRFVASYIYTHYRPGPCGHPRGWRTTSGAKFPEHSSSVSKRRLTLRAKRIGCIVSFGAAAGKGTARQFVNFPFGEDWPSLEESINDALLLYLPTTHTDGTRDGLRLLFEFDDEQLYRDVQLRSKFPLIVKWRELNKWTSINGHPLRWHISAKPTSAIDRASSAIWAAAAGVSMLASLPPAPSEMLKRPLKKGRLLPAQLKMLEAMEKIIGEGMRLTQFSNGYLGWSHPASHPDDDVWLLEGCTTPAILRWSWDPDNRRTFKLIGHAYIAGMMQGEVWSELQPEDLVEIVLI